MRLEDKLNYLNRIDKAMTVINKYGYSLGLNKGFATYAKKAYEMMQQDEITEKDIAYFYWIIRFLESYKFQIENMIKALEERKASWKHIQHIDPSKYYLDLKDSSQEVHTEELYRFSEERYMGSLEVVAKTVL